MKGRTGNKTVPGCKTQAQPVSALTRNVTAQLQNRLNTPPSPESLAQAHRLLSKWRAQLIENTIVARQGSVIEHGPFTGMHYDIGAAEGARIPRLLGCYEASLVPLFETVIDRAYPQIVDIGCAEGYYAVGLARQMPDTRVLARDTDPKAQVACRLLAERNLVADRIDIGGEWGHADFDLCKERRSFVLIDIEGAEDTLVNPARAPGLIQADLLVEVHEKIRPGLTEVLIRRFSPTHLVTRIDRALDSAALPDWMESFSDLDRIMALWEWRGGPTPWLWMERKI